MKLIDVENLLAARLGFDIHSVGRKAVEAAIRQSMKKAGFSDPKAYARIIDKDSDAWDYLVEKVVIPETWFFRDAAPFELIADLARARIRRTPPKALRILSCPCSTGEEPYSLAMTMLEAGASAESFTVDALDVNRFALKFAQAAVFSERSFRNHGLSYRTAYFDQSEPRGSLRLRSFVASLVQFRHGNIISPDFLADFEPYDFVFCRNLLIYLHPRARSVVMAALRRLLAKEGVLVLGHAEAAFAREQGFKPMGSAAAFAFVEGESRSFSKLQREVLRNIPANSTSRTAVEPMIPTVVAPAADEGCRLQNSDLSLLIVARQLGDSGKVDDALRTCREYLQRVPDSAEGYFLLGVLHDALGHGDLAASSFRRALYLNPSHREALLHLALKHDARGDGPAAALLRERARRSQDEGATE